MTDRLLRAFTEHPATVGETYWEHLAFALGFAGRLLLAGLAALVHAVLPFLFKTTASRLIAEMAARTGNRRPEAQKENAPASRGILQRRTVAPS